MMSRDSCVLHATSAVLFAAFVFVACGSEPTCADERGCATSDARPHGTTGGHAGTSTGGKSTGGADAGVGGTGGAHGGTGGATGTGGADAGRDGSDGSVESGAGGAPCHGSCGGSTPVCDVSTDTCV